MSNDDTCSDYVELYNPANQLTEFSGINLTADPSQPRVGPDRFGITALSTSPAPWMAWRSATRSQFRPSAAQSRRLPPSAGTASSSSCPRFRARGRGSCDFKLGGTSGETPGLFKTNRSALLETARFSPQTLDVSQGRLPDDETKLGLFAAGSEHARAIAGVVLVR